MIANSLAPGAAEGRTNERSNVFVIATLYCAAGSTAVRIRNLSPLGALVEGSVLPLAGSRFRLSRGSLTASGEVAWGADGRAGLRFGCSISVSDWLPGAGSSNGQDRVDELVFSAKHDRVFQVDASPPAKTVPSDLGFELGQLANGLTRLCEQLADDPHVAASFPENLQIIEATAQRLDRLANSAVKAPRDAC